MTVPTSFRVLNAAVPSERAEWEQLWSTWPDREVFAHPDFIDLFRGRDERALCLTQRTGAGGVLLPLMQRRLDTEQWIAGGGGLTDLVSAYGYGGAFYWGDVEASDFWDEVAFWACSEGAVSCFLRLSVISGHVLEPPCVVEQRSSNVVRDLDRDADTLWMDFEHKVRKNVKKARRAGLDIVEDASGNRLDDFLRIYYETMDRRTASSNYYFPRAFFTKLVDRLPGQFCFFHCCRGPDVVSTELVLVSRRNIYSFLGGTKQDSFRDRPNDLLKYHIVLWGKAHEKTRFVLGGGFQGDDGIFRYKRSFAPNGAVPFRVGTWVFDINTYEQLCAQRAKWERHNNRSDWVPMQGFFPAYRG